MAFGCWCVAANDETGTHDGTKGLSFGIPGGTRWIPAHCDAVLRRHFWFWAESYNSSANLNSPATLLGMHLTSVGRGCNMVLDLSPTPTGLVQDNDVAVYQGEDCPCPLLALSDV